MSPLSGLLHAFLVILSATGGLKMLRPGSTVDAMRSANLFPRRNRRLGRVAARALGLTELVLGLTVALSTSALALVGVAALYLFFNLFLRRLAAEDATASCGCLGMASPASNKIHYRLNGVGSAAFGLAGLGVLFGREVPTALDTLGYGLDLTIPYWVSVAVLAWLLVALPSLSGLVAPAGPGVPVASVGP